MRCQLASRSGAASWVSLPSLPLLTSDVCLTPSRPLHPLLPPSQSKRRLARALQSPPPALPRDGSPPRRRGECPPGVPRSRAPGQLRLGARALHRRPRLHSGLPTRRKEPRPSPISATLSLDCISFLWSCLTLSLPPALVCPRIVSSTVPSLSFHPLRLCLPATLPLLPSGAAAGLARDACRARRGVLHRPRAPSRAPVVPLCAHSRAPRPR